MPQGAIPDGDIRATAALFLRQVWENFLGPSLSFLLLMTGALQDPVHYFSFSTVMATSMGTCCVKRYMGGWNLRLPEFRFQ